MLHHEGLTRECERDIVGLVGVLARSRTIVDDIAELFEHATRSHVVRDHRRIDRVQPQQHEAERMHHQREPRAEAFALHARRRDHECELRGMWLVAHVEAATQAAEIGITDEITAMKQQERTHAGCDSLGVAIDDFGRRNLRRMSHQLRVARIVVAGGEGGRVLLDLVERWLDRGELAPSDVMPTHSSGPTVLSLPRSRYMRSIVARSKSSSISTLFAPATYAARSHATL